MGQMERRRLTGLDAAARNQNARRITANVFRLVSNAGTIVVALAAKTVRLEAKRKLYISFESSR
jgi:hypothetical protein